jgi:hypothetical protein
MKLLQLLVALLVASASAFAPSIGSTRGSSFASLMGAASTTTTTPRRTHSNGKSELYMAGGKQAKFGIFSPAVYAAKLMLGTEKLNKFRGKAISYHSQYIGDFCEWVGAYHLRTRLIKKAKTNGDTLGFLV